MYIQKIVSTEKEMLVLGRRLSYYCQLGDVFYLSGELGAGKTTFVRGLLYGLGYKGLVKSPSYTLIEIYYLETLEILHVDLYRLFKESEFWNIGLVDYLQKYSVLLIEWPEKAEKFLPFPTIHIHFNIRLNERIVDITFNSTVKNVII